MSCFKSLSLLGVVASSACSRQNVDPVAGPLAHNSVTNQHAVTQTIDGVPLHAGRRRDQIAPIDHPIFGSDDTHGAELAGEDLVVGVYFDGTARAYPLWILGSREIVN